MQKKNFIICVVIVLCLLLIIPASATLRCDSKISGCKNQCCTTGKCSSGTYSGQICGCKNGDPRISTTSYKADARAYLIGLGYTKSWYGTGYSSNDYTYAIGSGQCRYQAIVSDNNHYVRYKDGPEPNPQPAFCGDGNPDLWNPLSCVRSTIEAWHAKC